jgi:hypothetical protein
MSKPIAMPLTIEMPNPSASAWRLWIVASNSWPPRTSSTNAPATAVG